MQHCLARSMYNATRSKKGLPHACSFKWSRAWSMMDLTRTYSRRQKEEGCAYRAFVACHGSATTLRGSPRHLPRQTTARLPWQALRHTMVSPTARHGRPAVRHTPKPDRHQTGQANDRSSLARLIAPGHTLHLTGQMIWSQFALGASGGSCEELIMFLHVVSGTRSG